jgi:hypothetical protein
MGTPVYKGKNHILKKFEGQSIKDNDLKETCNIEVERFEYDRIDWDGYFGGEQ